MSGFVNNINVKSAVRLGSKTHEGKRVDFFATGFSDSAYLNSYFDIRLESYTKYLGLKFFNERIDEYDINSKYVLAVIDGNVIGGARINFSNGINNFLPLESKSFRLMDQIDFIKNNASFCEISRLAIKEGYRTGEISYGIISNLVEIARELNTSYLFSVATLLQARKYRLVFNKMGCACDIYKDLKLEKKDIYEHLNGKMVLSCTKL